VFFWSFPVHFPFELSLLRNKAAAGVSQLEESSKRQKKGGELLLLSAFLSRGGTKILSLVNSSVGVNPI